MNNNSNSVQDVLGYVDDLEGEHVKVKVRNGAARLKERCRRHLAEKAAGLWGILKSDRLSVFDKVMLAGAFLYCMVSADLISDLIPVVGYFDDLVIVLTVMMHLNRRTVK